jgi:hypothetical protein
VLLNDSAKLSNILHVVFGEELVQLLGALTSRAKKIFPILYDQKHLLYDDEEIQNNIG